MIIGIADTEMLAKKSHADMIQPYALREKAVLDFLNTVNPHLNYLPVPIQVFFVDFVSLTLLMSRNHSARRSREKRSMQSQWVEKQWVVRLSIGWIVYWVLGALRINEIRAEKGWNPLEIIQINLIEDESGDKFSSTALREKELRDKE